MCAWVCNITLMCLTDSWLWCAFSIVISCTYKQNLLKHTFSETKRNTLMTVSNQGFKRLYFITILRFYILGWFSRRWDISIWTGLGWPRLEKGGGRVSAVMNPRVPWNAENFLTSCKQVTFSRRTLHHGVGK